MQALKKAVEKKDVDASLSILQHDSSLVNLPSTEFIGTSSHRQPHAISLLGKAVLAGCLEIAELLIEAKANVNQTFTGDCSQLYLVYRNEEMFALLLAHPDIDVRVVDDCRSTVLHGTESVFYAAAFRQLLAANAPVDFVDDRGDTAFTILYFDPLAAELESEEEILDITRVLLEYNVNVNYQDPEGFCVLNRAAQYGHSTVVAALLEANASADVATWNGDTPLMGVGGEHNVSDSPECVQLLVAAGANVNATNKHGMTPLFFAGCRGHPLSTAVLLQAGATVAGDSKALQESLFRASFVGQLGFVKAVLRLRRRGGNALDDYRAHDWSEQGTPQECISLLLDAKLDINQTLTNGQPLLIWTIENEGYNETKLLLANGANRYCHDRSGRSSRQLAAHRSCSSLFECKMCVWRPLCCLPCRKEWCRVECERELVDRTFCKVCKGFFSLTFLAASSNCSLSADCRWYRKLAHQSVVQWAIAMSPLQFPPYVLEHIFNWLDFGYNPTRKARDHYERIATKRIAATRNVHPPLRINENYIHLMIEERSHSQNIKLFIAVHRAYRKTAVQTWQQ